MTTAAERTGAEISTPADPPLDLLYERSCQLADRVGDGTIGFLDAVDLAWEGALFAGTVDRVGPDLVQWVLACAFVGTKKDAT